jgi:hypothetical protein
MKKLAGFAIRYLYALVSALYLFTIGIFSSRHRGLIDTIYRHFGYVPPLSTATTGHVPQVDVREVIDEHATFQLREPIGVDAGNPSLLEIMIINKLIRSHQPSAIFEIGTFTGRTTLNMAANCAAQSRVYTLDLHPELSDDVSPVPSKTRTRMGVELVGSKYRGTDCEAKITQLYGDSATFDFSPYFNSIDFIFIDGAHSYNYVLGDSETALRLLRNGKGDHTVA